MNPQMQQMTVLSPVEILELVGDFSESDAARLYDFTPGTGGCLVRNRTPDAKGYTVLRVGPKTWKAHRLAWTLEHGPIPDGLTIDHLCEVKPCINTAHMEVVTVGENSRRRHGWRDGACSAGHDLTDPHNVVQWGHNRKFQRCRPCWNQYQRDFKKGLRRTA